MSVTPTGNPAWLRTNDHTAYGGHVNKANYQAIGTTNPLTDISAENLCRIAADLAAVARTAPFAVLHVTANDSTPAAPTIDDHHQMAGIEPTGARIGDGNFTLTWSASYSDPYGVSADVHIIAVTATAEGSGSAFAYVDLSDPDTNGKNERIEVTVLDDAGAAVADAAVSLVVYTGTT